MIYQSCFYCSRSCCFAVTAAESVCEYICSFSTVFYVFIADVLNDSEGVCVVFVADVADVDPSTQVKEWSLN